MAEINQSATAGNAALALVLETILTDLTNIRTQVNALVTNMTSRVSEHNALISKLNSDGSVSDADYVSAVSQTSAAVTTLQTTT